MMHGAVWKSISATHKGIMSVAGIVSHLYELVPRRLFSLSKSYFISHVLLFQVKSFDHEPTPEERAATAAWETRQLEIMDWLTDDVDWLTGEKHPGVERVL